MGHGNQYPSRLTPREIEVLKLIAGGHSTKKIAAALGITFKTACSHRGHIMEKLDIHNVADLTRYALRHGYIDTAEGGNTTQTEAELFERMRVAYAKFKAAMEDYDAFLEERTTFGFSTPDGATGARRLHAAEHDAHKQYHEALRELR